MQGHWLKDPKVDFRCPMQLNGVELYFGKWMPHVYPEGFCWCRGTG